MSALWLWVDVETTGLIEHRPAVLEVAWMVTDDDLRQLTPLRQRLTAIEWPPTWRTRIDRLVTSVLTLRSAFHPLHQWPSLLMPAKVDVLHVESGLSRDWRNGEKLTSIEELDAAIHEDHVAALQRHDPDGTSEVPLHLAGAGVAQFEARLFPALGSVLPELWHYRCADTSVAAMVAGVERVGEPAADDGLELDLQPGVDAVRASTCPHRAAADVRIAYRVAREVREARNPVVQQ